ncbi:MAG: aminoacyl-tRNA hydrolase [Gammaproteobacteria bacterium]|nr:aminoacyl-tRNA hydrolase [Gammaproteobacteria bacterium]
MSSKIALIAGLGNPGAKYEGTRHNVGFWFVDALAQSKGCTLHHDNKFSGEVGKTSIGDQTLWLIKPMTFMNLSGQAVSALANYYKISVDNILVVHDELDLEPGTVRLKKGGGHGGHNGLRDMIAHFNSKEFMRLRIGIGHPGTSSEVTNYVLGSPSKVDKDLLLDAIDDAMVVLPQIVSGEFQKAMNHLHSKK